MTKASHNGSAETVKLKASLAGNEQKPGDPDYLHLLGDAVRAARARRGMTRKMLATHSGVSERFLAQLESGAGNASVLVLRQIAQALGLPVEALLPGHQAQSPELTHTIELLRELDVARLSQARDMLMLQFG